MLLACRPMFVIGQITETINSRFAKAAPGRVLQYQRSFRLFVMSGWESPVQVLRKRALR